MSVASRRDTVRGLLGFGILAGVAPCSLSANDSVSIPDGPMRLTRVVTRSLRDGLAIRVERSWRMMFARQGRGIVLTGEQVAANVDAPDSLSGLAQIEEARSTAGMWPILLSSAGRIQAAGENANEADMAAAIDEATRMIDQRGLPATERAAQLEYLSRIQSAGAAALDRMPDDLFYPSGVPINSVQQVDLPGGLSGEFELNYFAVRSAGDPWLDHAVREVTTRIGSSQRQAREDWALSRI